MRTAGLVVALGGLLNVAFANVVCNTEAVHSKPRIISAAEKDGFATSIKEVCSTTDKFSESQSGSTVFTITGTNDDLGSDDCEAQFHAIIDQCVAGHNFGGGRFIDTQGLTLEVSTTDAEGSHALEARTPRGSRSRTGRTRTHTRTRRPKKTKTKKPKTKKPKTKKPKTKKPKTKTPTSCPLPHKKTGVKRFIPDFILKRAGSSSGAAGCSTQEEVTETNAFKSLAGSFPNAKNGEYYKFTSKSPFTEPGPNETEDELKQLQRKLGFNHISVIVGEVVIKETTIGKGAKAKKKVHKDFKASLIDLWKMKDGGSEFHDENFAPKKVFKLSQGAKTTAAKAAKAKAKGKAYFEDAKHKKYSVADNNCNTFAQELMGEI